MCGQRKQWLLVKMLYKGYIMVLYYAYVRLTFFRDVPMICDLYPSPCHAADMHLLPAMNPTALHHFCEHRLCNTIGFHLPQQLLIGCWLTTIMHRPPCLGKQACLLQR